MSGFAELHAALKDRQRWFEESHNPLYAWEAIYICLENNEEISLPLWCREYLCMAAKNLCQLSYGRDLREGASREKISPDRAMKLVANALSLSKQEKRSSSASVMQDKKDMIPGNPGLSRGLKAGGKETKTRRN